jgi:FkbM family methyltransferase
MKFFAKILNRLNLLSKVNLMVPTKINHQCFQIPVLGGLGYGNLSISEPWMIHLLGALTQLKKEGVYLDVGVNVGQTLLKLKSVNPQYEYIGFEPNPTCVHYAKKLIEANKFENISLYPLGIAGDNSIFELNFYSTAETDSTASMVENFRPNQKIHKKEFIPCYRIQDVFPKDKIPNISIVKIDVEGGELEVLKGLDEMVTQKRPFIQIEILPVYQKENVSRLDRQTQIEQLCKNWNYHIFRIHCNQQNLFSHLETIEEIGIHSNMDWCEYIFVPKELIEQLKSAIDKK